MAKTQKVATKFKVKADHVSLFNVVKGKSELIEKNEEREIADYHIADVRQLASNGKTTKVKDGNQLKDKVIYSSSIELLDGVLPESNTPNVTENSRAAKKSEDTKEKK